MWSIAIRRPLPSKCTSPSRSALSIAEDAVWPSPQIEASRIAWARSAKRASSPSTESSGAPPASRASSSSWRTVPTRHGTHWPHDSSRKNAAIRRSASGRSAVSSNTITTPEPSVAPAARVPSNVSGVSSRSGPTNAPAAPPSRIAWIARPPGTPPASVRSSPSVVAERRPRRRPGRRDVAGQAEQLRAGGALGPDLRVRRARPSRRISGTLTSVSTLLTAVGLPNRPISTGNGGLLRGSGRARPRSTRTAPSPRRTMYAPAPIRSSMSKAQPEPSDVVARAGRPRAPRGSRAPSRSRASGYSPRRYR